MAFSLEVPNVEEIKETVEKELAPTQEDKAAISNVVVNSGEQVLNVDLNSIEGRREITNVIDSFGKDIMVRSENKNAMLQRRLADIGGTNTDTATVAKDLEDLTIKMKDLDPSKVDFVKKGKFGKVTQPIRRYFEKYKSADTEIAAIIKSLDRGRTALKNDNTTLEIEEVNMRKMTLELNKNIEMGTQLDDYLTQALEQQRAEGADEDRIRFIENEVIFPLRQRLMDFQQLLVVNQQGIIAMEVIRKNNAELIRSVDRAKTVTVTSLRTAVTVAGALYNQKIVIDKVNLLNETTNNMISSTSKMLKDQGVSVQKQATQANISPDTLKQAFADAIQAMEDISYYRQEALPQMRATIDEFRTMAEEGEKQLSRIDFNG